ncbi:MAG: aspartate dehydrogenase [Blautia sp.]|nr:aspartate dehydrogenase [Blautia sp.]
MFGKKKKTPEIVYDPERQVPVIRSSICTGESVGCLKDKKTGALQEIMLIRNDQDLQTFQALVHETDIQKIY